MDHPYLTVRALTKYIKRKFEADPHLRKVFVKGELSNVKIHPSGHLYFTLKDDQSRIQAAMFRFAAQKLNFQPEEGMHVLITGDVNVYESSGQYQLYVQKMEPDGIGALFLAFEQLKKKLSKEGLFEERWKKPLPYLPQKVGVVTAQSGAAIRDIYSTITRRYPLAQVVLFPAIVQGAQAAPSIVEAIRRAQETEDIDVLIIGRGGGSIEDLWAFNEEQVARAIFSCRIPTISAVGHETDTTIADFVSDRRAPTPTAAAEMAVPSKEDLIERILERQKTLFQLMSHRLKQEKHRLSICQSSFPFQYPDRLYRPFLERLSTLEDRLYRTSKEGLFKQTVAYERLERMIHLYTPVHRIQQEQKNLALLKERLTRNIQHHLQFHHEQFSSSIRMLQALNPLSVMERGFSITYQAGKVVTSVQSVKEGDTIQLVMQDGQLEAKVHSIQLTEEV